MHWLLKNKFILRQIGYDKPKKNLIWEEGVLCIYLDIFALKLIISMYIIDYFCDPLLNMILVVACGCAGGWGLKKTQIWIGVDGYYI